MQHHFADKNFHAAEAQLEIQVQNSSAFIQDNSSAGTAIIFHPAPPGEASEPEPVSPLPNQFVRISPGIR